MALPRTESIEHQRDTRVLNDAAQRAPAGVIAPVTTVLRAVDANRETTDLVAGVMRALGDLITRGDAQVVPAREEGMSDYGYLLYLLAQPETMRRLGRFDAVAPARLRGLAAQERLLSAEGGPLTAPQIADLLNISRQAVDKRRRSGKLIAVNLGPRRWLYPAWQVGLEGLDEMLAALEGYSAWAKLAFALSGNSWLDNETPLSALRRGDVAGAVHAARMYGEQVAS